MFLLVTLEFPIPKDKVDSFPLRSIQIVLILHSTLRELEFLLGQLGFTPAFVPLGRPYILSPISWLITHSSPSIKDPQLKVDNSYPSFLLFGQVPDFLYMSTPLSVPSTIRENNILKYLIPPFLNPLSPGMYVPPLHRRDWDSRYIIPPVPWMEVVLRLLQMCQGKGSPITP